MPNDQEPIPPMQYYGPTDSFGFGQLREIWLKRELLYSFFLRDLLIRYRQVVVGILWVLLQPLMGMLIFMGLFFVLGTQAGNSNVAYAPIVLTGMLCWQLVASSFRDATGSLVNYRHVVTKIYFPRMLLPLSSLLCATFDFAIGSILLLPVCWLSSTAIVWSTAWLALPIAVWLIMFCAGCIAWLSALNAHYRDVGYALPFVLQLGMFVSPVVYDIERLRTPATAKWIWIYEANPIATCIGLFRWALMGTAMPTVAGMVTAGVITIVICLSGLAWFQQADQQLADRI
jgi:lipopolysaccharide transport system permease protein